MALCLKLLGNVRRDLLAYHNGCLYTVCHFIPIFLSRVLMRRLAREAPLDLQVKKKKNHNLATLPRVLIQGTEDVHQTKPFKKVLTAIWLLKLADMLPHDTWNSRHRSLSNRNDFFFPTSNTLWCHEAYCRCCRPKWRLNPRCNFSLSFSCIVSFSLRGRGQ